MSEFKMAFKKGNIHPRKMDNVKHEENKLKTI